MGRLKLKDRKGSNRSVSKKHSQGSDRNKNLKFLSYDVTYEPIDHDKIPGEIQEEIEKLHDGIQNDPGPTVERLKELIEKYPDVPMLYNYISVAYNSLKNQEMARTYTEKNYENNPDYLFARLNYAGLYITEKNYEKVAEILDNKFDVKLLYPERNVFHISEVVGMGCLACQYYLGIGETNAAKLLFENLMKMAPDHPTVMALKNSLFIEMMTWKFEELFNKKKKESITIP